MIESTGIAPGLHVVARLATGSRAIGSHAVHRCLEFSVVRIVVAGGASLFRELELRGGHSGDHGCAVAIHARHGQMRPLEGEPRLPVIRQREFRGAVSVETVAAFASVQIRRGDELSAVLIAMAIEAAPKCDLVLGCRAGRGVAFRAGDVCVFAQQRIF